MKLPKTPKGMKIESGICMKVIDIVTQDNAAWAVIETSRGIISFTLNEDHSIYVLNRNGGCEQDSESLFMQEVTDEEIAELKQLSEVFKKDIES
jgi:hypothetical protein